MKATHYQQLMWTSHVDVQQSIASKPKSFVPTLVAAFLLLCGQVGAPQLRVPLDHLFVSMDRRFGKLTLGQDRYSHVHWETYFVLFELLEHRPWELV